MSLNALKVLYDRLKDEITKYAGMNKLPNEEDKTWFGRQAQKLRWHFFAKDTIQDVRDKITGQITLLQPALTARHFQGAAIQSQLFHEESLTNFDDLKVMLRVIYHHLQTTSMPPAPSLQAPTPAGDPSSLSRASTLVPSPDDCTAYTTASQQLSPFLPPPNPPPKLASSLHRLRITYKLHIPLKTFLTTLDSPSPQHNILWVHDHPASTQISAIIHSVLTSQDKPILSFSASHINPANRSLDVPAPTLLIHAIYTFLHQLLNYLTTHPTPANNPRRIDAPSFGSLDGTQTTLPTALLLLGNLLDELCCPCVFVLDNMQFLDKPALQPYLADFYALFSRKPNRVSARYEGSHKLLVTTRGGSAGLSDRGIAKGLGRCATNGQVVSGSGGVVVWEEVKGMVEGWVVPEMVGKD